MHNTHSSFIANKTSAAKKSQYLHAKHILQTRLRQMKDSWWENKAQELQEAADKHNMKLFHEGLRAVYGPKSSGSAPIRSLDGEKLHTDKAEILTRWAEHFNSLLNRPSSMSEEALDAIPQRQVLGELELPPSLHEVTKAIKQTSSGKSPGADGIPAEIYKHGGDYMRRKLTHLFKLIWDKGTVPQEFKDASIVHLYKRKGNRTCCDNHRGISLLAVAGKILARIVLNRMTEQLINSIYPESQCGFRPGRGTTNMIFAVRQIQEKCREQNQDLYMVFVDLTKAFNTVNHDGLWKILHKLGCPEKFVSLIRSFHEGMLARVQECGESSDPFPVTNGTTDLILHRVLPHAPRRIPGFRQRRVHPVQVRWRIV